MRGTSRFVLQGRIELGLTKKEEKNDKIVAVIVLSRNRIKYYESLNINRF